MPKRILMIDDERDFTELTRSLLGFYDFEVDTYNESFKVEDVAATERYDLVVSDLMMPNMDGFAIIRKLRAKEAYKTTPIIALSAKTLTDEERKFLLQNNVHFIPKPFEPQGLVEKITQLLSG